MITRRELLTSSIAAAGVGTTAPAWLVRAVHAAEQASPDAREATNPEGRILVVVLMVGGNDGLNTLVPFADARYREARPTLRIDADKVLGVGDGLGFHPSLKLLRERFERGEVAVLQSVGYPHPNRSHFAALDIWHSADPAAPLRTGWLGRYADGIDPEGVSPSLLVQIGSSIPLSLRRGRTPVLAMDDADSLSLTPDRKYPADKASQEAAFRKLCARIHPPRSGKPTYADILRETAASGLASADEVSACLAKAKNAIAYPRGLGTRLALIARMIAGGMKTRVYFTTLANFDHHAKQWDPHADLLRGFSNAVDAFYGDLAVLGRARNVVLMSFSEFGRRVAENASGGTDHGAAGPVFVVGPAVKGGLYGSRPDLEKLVDGDVTHSTDFRSVYATLVKDWLGAPLSPAISGEFPTIPFLPGA